MKKVSYLILIALLIASTTFVSCKKDDDDDDDTKAVVTSCFPDSYNGTYDGSGNLSGTPAPSIELTVTKLSCTTCKIDAGSVVENVVSLEESKDGGYKGKDEDGNDVSIQLSGTTLQVNSDEISFNGDKQ